MKIVFPLLLLALGCNLGTSKEGANRATFAAPFNGAQYDSVVAYEFEPTEEVKTLYKNKFNSVVISNYHTLIAEEASNISKVLLDTNTYAEGMTDCFNPHFAVLYFQNGKPVDEVIMCFDCHNLLSSRKIKASKSQYKMAENSSEGVKKLEGCYKSYGFKMYMINERN